MPAKPRLHVAPATGVSLAVILALVAVGLVPLGSASTARSRGSRTQRRAEAANQPQCGDTITADTTLHQDLVNCPNNGIIIGADNLTLDLNGHRIHGDGTEFADCPKNAFCDVGVLNDGHDGVAVMDGSVRQFAVGAFVGQARHNRLVGISSSRNRFFGLSLVRDRDLRVLGASATRNGFFGIFFWCDRCLVRNSAGNRTKGSGPDQVGMFLFQSHHDRILHNTFRDNVPTGSGTGGGIASRESTNTVIRGNLMSNNGEAGIIMESSDGFQISHNRLVRNHDGISLGPGSDNVITRNHVFGGGDGIRIEKGHGNLVAHNVVAHTRRAGIHLGFHVREGIFGGAHNIVRRNLIRDSRKDGFLVGRKDRHSRLKGNVAKRSGDDGFHVESRSAKLSNNRAVRNNDLGIEAVRGVNDGGGNVARHNGDPRQCTNIACN